MKKTAECCYCGNVKELSEMNYQKVKIGLEVHCFECNRPTPHEFGTQSEQKPHQVRLEVGGNEFMADKEMVPLLVALNSAGLETRAHCSGHGGGSAFVAIRMDNVTDVQIRNDERFREIVIIWKPSQEIIKQGK